MSLFRTVLSRFLLPFFLLLATTSVFSAEEDIETLKKALAKNLPNIIVSSINETPLPGVFEVMLGDQVVYLGKNARYMMNGDMIDLSTRKNLTEAAKFGTRLAAMTKLGEENMLVYTPEKVDHTITVITDIDCRYCRQLHSEMDQYMENNVKVRYIFMPLRGKADYIKTVSVWCAKDQNKALDLAKQGGNIETLNCDNPIKQHLAMARGLGVNGTPAIIMETGELLPGYVEVSELLKELNKAQPVVAN